ncbi:hypothetical protein ACFH04_07930 [Streptomyces noboritoensis]|uniref:Uncharacterized protein n=1 Tax=Streptomyces noboritoensis TaxID=67337 RepID=A0ABV6TD03_9ACTN
MTNFENVVLRTTKSVVRKTTQRQRPEAEFERQAAWAHLYTPQAPDIDEWRGELAKVSGLMSKTGLLAEIAAKYDRLLRLTDLDALDEITDTDLLAALVVIRALRDKLDLDEYQILKAARSRKITWQRLADAEELACRQSAERRYLQLRTDLDEVRGEKMTQSERVEYARALKERGAERQWAFAHRERIVFLARRLSEVADLQTRADRSTHTRQAGKAAVWAAKEAGQDPPPPARALWPAQLTEALTAEEAHRNAVPEQTWDEYADHALQGTPSDGGANEGAVRLTPVQLTTVYHTLFGMIGYALLPDHIDLSDHPELVADIRHTYEQAGPAAPRITPPAKPRQEMER